MSALPKEIRARFPAVWLLAKPTHLKVLLAISAHADNHTGEAFPKIARLAEMTGLTPTHVYRALREIAADPDYAGVEIGLEVKGKPTFKVPALRPKSSQPEPPVVTKMVTSIDQNGHTMRPKSSLPIRNNELLNELSNELDSAADAAQTSKSEVEKDALPLPSTAVVGAKRPGKKPARLVSSAEREVAGLLRERYERVLGIPWDSAIERRALADARRMLDIPGRTTAVIAKAFAAMAADEWWGAERHFVALGALAKQWGKFAPAGPVQPRLTAVPSPPPKADPNSEGAKRRAAREEDIKRRIAERRAAMQVGER